MIQDNPYRVVVATSNEIPFEAVSIDIDHKKFRKLLDKVSKGRKAKFHNVVFSGGVSGEVEINEGRRLVPFVEQFKHKDLNYFIAGTFSEARRDVKIYPESFLLLFLKKFIYELDDEPTQKQVEELRVGYGKSLAKTLLEELEHGHQDFMEWKYFWSEPDRRIKFFSESKTAILTAYAFYFATLIATNQLNNIPAIVAGFMILIVPAILMSLDYKFSIRGFKNIEEYQADRAEKDAKDVANDPELIKLAEQVLQSKIMLDDEALLTILKAKQGALDEVDKLQA